MEELFNLENIFIVLTSMAAVITTGLAIQWRYYRHTTENLKTKHAADLQELKNQHSEKYIELKQQNIEKYHDLEESLKKEYEIKKIEISEKNNVPLVQELKMVYVKYLHIRKESEEPIYSRFIKRLNKSYDIHSEYHYYRFNKYNQKNNNILLRDISSGIVDQRILHPWKKLTFTDKPSMLQEKVISQMVDNSDDYFSATTYYNGFKENNEDLYSKMEMETLCARLVADFSSVIGFQNLFTAEPDAYKIEIGGSETKLLGLEKLDEGVYFIESYNLKKGETLKLDFHVNWNYLLDKNFF
ncbi:hypothetical protein [Salinimicrobium marinum]|nr:hypothetical protein [Salinimicrobium marinum]